MDTKKKKSVSITSWYDDSDGIDAAVPQKSICSNLHPFQAVLNESEAAYQKRSTSVEVTVDLRKISRRMNTWVKTQFGKKSKTDLLFRDNRYWIVAEFQKERTFHEKSTDRQLQYGTKLPVGTAGFEISFDGTRKELRIFHSNHFFVGFIPTDFFHRIPQMIEKAFRLDSLTSENAVEYPSFFELRAGIGFAAIPILSAPAEKIEKDVLRQFSVAITERREHQLKLELASAANRKITFDREKKTPIEVLEAREISGELYNIDSSILNGDLDEAVHLVQKAENDEKNSKTFLNRRKIILFLSGKIDIKNLDPFKHQKTERLDLFSLSVAVTVAFTNDNLDRALDQISEFGQHLQALLDPLPNSFDIILPELLGDAWRSQDLQKALQCYNRVLVSRGLQPRLLHKIINIYKKMGHLDKEWEILEKLKKVEKRSEYMSALYLRQAMVLSLQGGDDNQAIELSLRAFDYNKGEYRAVLNAANILDSSGLPQQAVDVLDQALEEAHFTPKQQALLEFRVGEIWQQSLSRNDLAARRYLRSIQLDPDQKNYKRTYQDLLLEEQDYAAVTALLETRIIQESLTKRERFEIFKDLCQSYRILEKPHEASIAHKGMLENYNPESDEQLEFLLEFDHKDIQLDWNEIYNKNADKIHSTSTSDADKKLHMSLGRLALSKLNDPERAKAHFLSAVSGAEPDSAHIKEFRTFAVEHNYLDELIPIELKIAEESREYSDLKKVFAKLNLASKLHHLKLHVEKNSKTKLLREVLSSESIPISAILQLTNGLHEKAPSSKLKVEFAQLAVDLWSANVNSSFSDRHWVLEREDAHEFINENLALLLNYELTFGKTKRASETAKKLILSGQPPNLHGYEPEEIFTDKEDLAFYFQSLGTLEANESIRSDLAQQALRTWLQANNPESAIALYMAQKSPPKLGLDDIRAFADGARGVRNIADFIKLFVDQGRLQPGLTEDITEIEMSLLQEVDPRHYRVDEILEIRYKSNPKSSENQYQWICHLHSMERYDQAYSTVRLFLSTHLTKDHFEKWAEIATLFLTHSQVRPLIDSVLVQTVLNDPRSWIEATKALGAELYESENGFYIHLIERSLELEAIEQLTFLIIKWMDCFQSAAFLRTSLKQLIPTAQRLKRVEVLQKSFLKIGKEMISYSENDPLRIEMEIARGLVYFANQFEPDETLDLLRLGTSTEPVHEDVFVPTYFLLRDSDDLDQFLEFLESWIPMISDSPQMIENSPLTIESLLLELESLHSDLERRKQLLEAEVDEKQTQSKNIVPPGTPPSPHMTGYTQVKSKHKDFVDQHWAEYLRTHQFPENAEELILLINDSIILSAEEKLTAVQVVALNSGRMELLDYLNTKPWDSVERSHYSSNYGEQISMAPLQSATHNWVKGITPFLTNAYSDKFQIEVLAKSLKINVETLKSSRQPIDLHTGTLKTSGAHKFSQITDRHGYIFFDLPGLNSSLFFDGQNRAFYLDLKYLQMKPKNFLFHKLGYILWLVHLGYYPIVFLRLEKYTLPLWESIKHSIETDDDTSLRNFLGSLPENIQKIVFQSAALDISVEQIQRQINRVNSYIYQKLYAESFDLIGIVEAISEKNLLPSSQSTNIKKILIKHPEISDLIGRILDWNYEESATANRQSL